MRFHRTNDVGRRRHSVPTTAGYSGGRPYRSFSRPPVKYSSIRSQPRDLDTPRRTPYGRVRTLRYDLDRIPGDRNYIRIRQIASKPRVTVYRPPEHLARERVVKRSGNKVSQLLSPLQWGGGMHVEDYETPGQRENAYWRTNPPQGVRRPAPAINIGFAPARSKRVAYTFGGGPRNLNF